MIATMVVVAPFARHSGPGDAWYVAQQYAVRLNNAFTVINVLLTTVLLSAKDERVHSTLTSSARTMEPIDEEKNKRGASASGSGSGTTTMNASIAKPIKVHVTTSERQDRSIPDPYVSRSLRYADGSSDVVHIK